MRRLLPPFALLAVAAAIAGCGGKKLVLQASTRTTPAPTTASAATTAAAPATAPPTTAAKAACAPARQPQPRTEETSLSPPVGELAPGHNWEVVLDTNCGLITIDLDTTDSPKTAASFAALVRRGFFNNLTFHRIAAGADGTPFVIQGGDPVGTGAGGPGYTVVEPPPTNVDYRRGVVAMAKTSAEPAGTSGSQFFIVTAPDAELPAQYALLGHVSAGMGAVQRIAAQPTLGNEQPTSPIVIRAARLSER